MGEGSKPEGGNAKSSPRSQRGPLDKRSGNGKELLAGREGTVQDRGQMAGVGGGREDSAMKSKQDNSEDSCGSQWRQMPQKY